MIEPNHPDGGGREAEQPAGVDSLPLSDVKVLDLSRLLPGGFCSQLLADFGADVVKVEDTGIGDYVRWAPPLYGSEEQQGLGTRSALYLSLNRNKRSIRLDLKSEGGREALLRLVREFDVVLESFRPGVLDRLGVGYERMAEENPALVYCAITGYGQTGPNTQRAGHDMNYLGLIGLLGLTGEPEGRPIQSAGQIADIGGGALPAAFGIMAALHESRRSGEGQVVDVSMADGALSWLAMVAGAYLCDGEVPGRGDGQLTGRFVCYLPYEAADGHITMGALEPQFWARFCAGVGREDLVAKQFERAGSEAWGEVAEIFRSRTRAEWESFNDEHDAMIEPVLDLDEALGSELVREREMVVEWEQPELGPVRQLGVPVKLSRTPGGVHAPAPALGEHTREVLSAAGFDESEIDALLGVRRRRRAGRGGDRPSRSWADGGAWGRPGRPRRRSRGGRRNVDSNLGAGRARRRPGRHGSPLPARGPVARAGEDIAQHGLLPARVRGADPADQAAPGTAVHAPAGDPRAARLGRRRPRAAAGARRHRRRARGQGARSRRTSAPRRRRSCGGSRSRSGRSSGSPSSGC